MPTMTLGNGNIIIDDELQRQASDLVDQVSDHDVDAVTVRFNGQVIQAPPELAKLITTLIEGVACGAQTSVQTLPTELTTTAAADVLGVSRPTLMKLVRADTVRWRKVGTHTRVRTEDVLHQRKLRHDNRQAAFDELRRASEEFEDG